MNSLNNIRLQKFIAMSGYCSRRKAEVLINEGKVKVNGIKVTEQGLKVSTEDRVMVNGILINVEEKKVYYISINLVALYQVQMMIKIEKVS